MTQHQHLFGEDYFMHGVSRGISNYENYEWKRDLTVFCCARMMMFLGAKPPESVLDVGAARGFYCAAMRLLGYEAYGYDISEWAVENCHPDVRQYMDTRLRVERGAYDWATLKDLIEHVPPKELERLIASILCMVRRGALIIVPLRDAKTGNYVAPQDNLDATHINCWSMEEWLEFLQARIDESGEPFVAMGSFKLPGVKEACDPFPKSVAFITLRRL